VLLLGVLGYRQGLVLGYSQGACGGMELSGFEMLGCFFNTMYVLGGCGFDSYQHFNPTNTAFGFETSPHEIAPQQLLYKFRFPRRLVSHALTESTQSVSSPGLNLDFIINVPLRSWINWIIIKHYTHAA